MHGAVAAPDPGQAVRDRVAGDLGGLAGRVGQRQPGRQAGRQRRGVGAAGPWVAATSYLGTGIERWRCPSKRWSAGSAPCPPVTSAAAAPIATSRSASAARSSVARPVSACASGRLGVTTVASGNSRPISVATASGSSSRGARAGHHDRVDHERKVPPGQLVGDRPDDGGGEEHAGLGRPGADVVKHRSYLLADERGRQLLDRGHAEGVLRGEGHDGGHPVRAAAGERLQVGLNPGPAARVGRGDRQHPG